MWEPVIPLLQDHYRILRYDQRGHGQSIVRNSDFTMIELVDDILALVAEVGSARFAFAGVSLGGMIAQRLGTQYGERLTHLVISNSSGDIGGLERWNARIENVLRSGMNWLVEPSLSVWFTKEFLQKKSELLRLMVEDLKACEPRGYAACSRIVKNFRSELDISGNPFRRPVVICGETDPATPLTHSQDLASNWPEPIIRLMAGSHLSGVEYPEVWCKHSGLLSRN